MRAAWPKRIAAAAVLACIAAGFAYLLWPRPIGVDAALIAAGPMEVTVDEEGVNRIRNIYVVSAPVSGRAGRALHDAGDRVEAGVTVVATFRPADAAMLDPRTRLELRHALEAVKAARDLATVQLQEANANLSYAEAALKRTKTLAARKVASLAALEKAELDAKLAEQQAGAAKALLDMRSHDVETAEARLATPAGGAGDGGCCITLTAPVSGIVVKKLKESEQILPAGTPLMEIGDPRDTEITVDLLSSDAIRVRPGAPASITGWGGARDLKARVKRVDPAAFTKVSALGIEEQRVRTVLEFLDPPEARAELGHDYRVFVRVTVWRKENAVQVPLGALFRQGGGWAVFRIMDGRARLAPVKIGAMNTATAEVLQGLEPGIAVILHPGDQVADGTSVDIR